MIVTHVHLDHAGGAGLLMQSLPNARLVAHPRGAPHMIDPSALYEGAKAVYGEDEMQRTYGDLVPVPAARVQATHDGMTLRLGKRALQFLDTPGHARHHHCVWDARSRGFFTGDTFGLSYREFDNAERGAFLMPTTTPVQFEPDALRISVQRLLAFAPERMYLTHYGSVGQVERLAAMLLLQIDEMVALAKATPQGSSRHDALKQGLLAISLKHLREHRCTMSDAAIASLLALDLELNAQGLAGWLERSARKARTA